MSARLRSVSSHKLCSRLHLIIYEVRKFYQLENELSKRCLTNKIIKNFNQNVFLIVSESTVRLYLSINKYLASKK